ncbi:metal ABC transporter substrate-binding protein [Clostridium sp. N37]|uniref:Lipoprotein n=2 Tax=Clostridium faecium TaxID=2762223 RepID=A0ABR8YTM7_9CLOT|nr:metal ABC transporter substrate-binding protein [Clostridium faecium]
MKMKFKKILSLITTLALSLGLIACGKTNELKTTTDVPPKDIIVGVCAGPYGDMFKDAIQPSLEEKGYKVTIKEFSDYVQPNKALANKEIDLNMFQHSVYLEKFATGNNLKLTAIAEIPTAGMGIYSNKVKSLDELKEGALVTIPDDPTNLTRALKVLEAAGLITIDHKVENSIATEKDLSENPKKLEFKLIEAPQLPRTLDSADLAVINGNFAIAAALNPSEALYNEKLSDGYINVIAVRTEDADSQLSKDVVEIVKSSKFKSVIDDPNGQYKAFQKPADY